MCEKNGFFGAYPWSKPAGCNCNSGSSGSDGEGVTREEVEEIISNELQFYATTDAVNDLLLEYIKSDAFKTTLLNYPTKENISQIIRGLVTTAALNDAIAEHDRKVAGTYLGHVRGIAKTSQYTDPVAVDSLGMMWIKPNECTVKPITATPEMTQPVGVDSSGLLFTKPSEGGSGFPTVYPSGDMTGVTDVINIRRALENNEGIIYLSNGTFYINECIEIPENRYLYGHGGIGNSPSKVRSGEEKFYSTAVIVPAGCDNGAFYLKNENSCVNNMLICGGGVGTIKFPNWLTHVELIRCSRDEDKMYDTDGCGIIYGGSPDATIAGADVQAMFRNLCIIGFPVAGIKYLPASWCSYGDTLTIRRCSAGILTCVNASDNTLSNIHVDNCTDNFHFCGTGNFRINGIKSFASGCLQNDGVRSGVGKSYGLYMDGCGCMMINNFEIQDCVGSTAELTYCFNNQLTLMVDRGRTSYSSAQQGMYHVEGKCCFENTIIINCNKHLKGYRMVDDGVHPTGHNTVMVRGCNPDGTQCKSVPYETDDFYGVRA